MDDTKNKTGPIASGVPNEQSAIVHYVIGPRTVDLNNKPLLALITGGLIRTRDKALKLSRRKVDPLPVHRLSNGQRGSLYINTDEYDVWSKRQELI